MDFFRGTSSTLPVPAFVPLRRAWCRGLSLSKSVRYPFSLLLGQFVNLTRRQSLRKICLSRGLSAGPFHALPLAVLRRGSSCGHKIDVNGIQLTSRAARFRVASCSAQLTPGMARIRAAMDHCDRTLDSFTVSWDKKYYHSSTAYSATSAFQLVYGMDSLRCLRDLRAHKMQSDAATLLRQSGNILDIAQAICKRSNRVLGFVNQ